MIDFFHANEATPAMPAQLLRSFIVHGSLRSFLDSDRYDPRFTNWGSWTRASGRRPNETEEKGEEEKTPNQPETTLLEQAVTKQAQEAADRGRVVPPPCQATNEESRGPLCQEQRVTDKEEGAGFKKEVIEGDEEKEEEEEEDSEESISSDDTSY